MALLAVLFYDFGSQPAAQRYLCTVTGVSMEPTFHEGDQVYIQKFPADQYVPGSHVNRTGDIIGFNATIFLAYGDFSAYKGGILLVLHRAVDRTYRIDHFWFRTQGDNDVTNPVVDSFTWEAYNYSTAEPSWWGTYGWLCETLILGEVVEIVEGG